MFVQGLLTGCLYEDAVNAFEDVAGKSFNHLFFLLTWPFNISLYYQIWPFPLASLMLKISRMNRTCENKF